MIQIYILQHKTDITFLVTIKLLNIPKTFLILLFCHLLLWYHYIQLHSPFSLLLLLNFLIESNITSIMSLKYVTRSWQMTIFLKFDKCFPGYTKFSALINELARKLHPLFVIYGPFLSNKQWDFQKFYCFLQNEALISCLCNLKHCPYHCYTVILYRIGNSTNKRLFLNSMKTRTIIHSAFLFIGCYDLWTIYCIS